MKTKYLIRLDDACPQMNKQKWQCIEDLLDKYGIKPIVGIIPHNEDSETCIDIADDGFVDKAQNWQKKGWTVALHGYNHVCTTIMGGLNPIHNRSEFAGLSLIKQEEKISKGYKLLVDMGLKPTCFFAPSHTYDENTLKALIDETPIRIISDIIAFRPYRYGSFTIIPCQMGRFRKILFGGYWTFCFHPNNMSHADTKSFENFIKTNADKFIRFCDIEVSIAGEKSIFDKLLSVVYFTLRRIRKK